jgi:hypothetical protein
MAWLVVLLLTLVALGNLIDFILGPPGQRKIKDRLVEWYVAVADGNWAEIVHSSARTTSRFLDHLLGIRIVSMKAIGLTGIASCIVTALVLSIALGFNFSFLKFIVSDSKVGFWNGFNMLCIIAANATVDLVSIAFTRYLLKEVGEANKSRTLIFALLVQVVFTYVSVVFVMALSESIMLIFSGGAFIGLEAGFLERIRMIRTLFLAFFPKVFLSPWREGAAMNFGGTNLLIFGCIAALPTLFSAFVLLAAWTLQSTRKFTQRPVALVIERLEGSPKGLFTTISVALSALAGLVGALTKALS